ncbi:CinA family nicotinamide mononucleotide deamidase-related protein [Staphylococcus massiliensis]|uniref:CinA family nicotinamide mononucleotide deamidase-related protein n=1 Tax=Staphylococcus massiliensis TaxID=555791 RepID=UPI001EE14E1D|nr:CinA family nicotinamide mononucleotide deamidase-related protein [Staphylococcus massiliensis]MCG3398726.1 CinA family nicotinamide mononucleotide deamidase-related protein [Staphylococcus massiliensis]
MKICIIAVGSELLLGQITNTNGTYLSQRFNEVGHDVLQHIVVGDNPKRLERVMSEALKYHDAVILTGGLGPTKDDLTKQTVASLFNTTLEMDQEAMTYIENYFKEQNKTVTPNNKQQALVIKGSKVLKNEVGMAPGMYLEKDSKIVALLPGPPRELKPMVKHELMPYFTNDENTIYSEMLKFCGIGESQVETELMDLIDAQTNPTIAPLAGAHEVKIRLTSKDETIDQCKANIQPVKDEILSRIGMYYYGSDDVLLEEAFMHELQDSISIYDEVSEGALYPRLQAYNDQKLLTGYLPENEAFVDPNMPVEARLEFSAQLVQSLFKSKIGISICNEGKTIYVGILKNDHFKSMQFEMSHNYTLKRDRSQNYVLIRLLKDLNRTT